MRGEYGKEVGSAAEQLTAHMDKLISGCFRGFEQSYNKLERTIREGMDWRKNGGLGVGGGRGRQRRRQTTLQLMARGSSSSSSGGRVRGGRGGREAGRHGRQGGRGHVGAWRRSGSDFKQQLWAVPVCDDGLCSRVLLTQPWVDSVCRCRVPCRINTISKQHSCCKFT